jgi:hypothetical protein
LDLLLDQQLVRQLALPCKISILNSNIGVIVPANFVRQLAAQEVIIAENYRVEYALEPELETGGKYLKMVPYDPDLWEGLL